jgi:ABC-type multidrug transport system fused ATPase/permease subunit
MEPLASNVEVKFVPAMRRLFAVMSPARRRQFYRLLALMLAGAVAEFATVASVVPFLAMLADPDRGREFPLIGPILANFGAQTNWDMLVAAAALFTALAIISALVRLQLVWSTHSFVFGFGHELAVEIHERILSQPYVYHLQHGSTDLLTALRKAELLVFDVLLQVFYCAIAVLLSLFIVGALIVINPATSLAAIAFVGTFYLLATRFSRTRLRTNSRVFDRYIAQRVQVVQESVGGIRDIIIDGSKAQFVEEFAAADRRISQAHVSNALIGSAPRYVIEAASLMLVAALALYLSSEQGLGAAVPILGALALGAQRLLPLVQQVYNAWATVAGHWLVTTDVLKALSLPVPDPVTSPPTPIKLDHEVRLEDVSFAYPGRKSPALKDISIRIPRGSRVAIVGRTGSGKSTLADLLMGLLEPSSGQISIDGVLLDGGTRTAWQRSIAHVPQSAFVADTTIARNIAFGTRDTDIDVDRVRAAAKHAQLDGFVTQLPEGYETLVGERGIGLSGGQRQRLALARAFYKNAPVVVLDEATSALDDETEVAILASLNAMAKQGRTIVVIAHRPTSIAQCDLIVRLHEGRLTGVETDACADAVSARRNP